MKKKIRDKLLVFLMALSFIFPLTTNISAKAVTQSKNTITYTGSQIAKSLPNLGWYSYNGGYAWNKYGKNRNVAGILGKIYILNGIGDNDVILILDGYSSNFKSEILNTLKLLVPTQYNYLYNYITKVTSIDEKTINIDGRQITFKVDKSGAMTIYFGGVDMTKVDISTSVTQGDLKDVYK